MGHLMIIFMATMVLMMFTVATDGKPSPITIVRDDRVELPGYERISKRSAVDMKPSSQRENDEERQIAEFVKDGRVAESQSEQQEKHGKSAAGLKRATLEIDDDGEVMARAANTIVFRPLFRSRENRLRLVRSVLPTKENGQDDGMRQVGKRHVPSFDGEDRDNVALESMETAADMVFRPLFRRRLDKIVTKKLKS